MIIKYVKGGVERSCKAYFCRKEKVPDVDLYQVVTFNGQDFSIYRSYRKAYRGDAGYYLYIRYDERWWYANDKEFYFTASFGSEVKIEFDKVPPIEKTSKRKRSSIFDVTKVLVPARSITENMAERAKDENSDCTVVSFAHAYGVSYDTAHELLERLGRQKGKGFHLQQILAKWAAEGSIIFGKKVEQYNLKKVMNKDTWKMSRETIGGFIKKGLPGTYILISRSHANTYRDGKLIDHSFQPRTRLYNAFKIYDNV